MTTSCSLVSPPENAKLWCPLQPEPTPSAFVADPAKTSCEAAQREYFQANARLADIGFSITATGAVLGAVGDSSWAYLQNRAMRLWHVGVDGVRHTQLLTLAKRTSFGALIIWALGLGTLAWAGWPRQSEPCRTKD